MQGEPAKRVRNRKEKQAVAGKRGTYGIEDADPVFCSFDMRKHAEERCDQVVRARCSCSIEVGRDQQTLAAVAGGRGPKLQRLARVNGYVIRTYKRIRGVQEWQR